MFAQDHRGAELAQEGGVMTLGGGHSTTGWIVPHNNESRWRRNFFPDADCAQEMRVKHMRSALWRGAQQKGQQCRQIMISRTGGMFLEWRVFSDIERYSYQVWSRTGSGGIVTMTNYLNKK